MAVRNLKYEGTIVDQPIHDGVELVRWIHDGVIVWENGGFSDVIFSDYTFTNTNYLENKVCCLDTKNKKGYWYDKGNTYMAYILDGYIVNLNVQGYSRYWATDDYTCEGLAEKNSTNNYAYVVPVDKRKLLGQKAFSSEFYAIELDQNDAITETLVLSLDSDHSTYHSYSHNMIGSQPYILYDRYDTEGVWYGGASCSHEKYYVYMVDIDGTNTLISDCEYYQMGGNDEYGHGTRIMPFRNFDINGITYLLCYYDVAIAPADTLAKWVGKFGFIKLKNGVASVHNRDLANDYDRVNNVYGIKCNPSTNEYYIYYYALDENNITKLQIWKANENLELISQVTVPDYIDIELSQEYDGYHHIRLYSNESGRISESGYYLHSMTKCIGKNVEFNSKSKVVEPDSITFGLRFNFYVGLVVHIDNLTFQDSENNYAIVTN